MKMMTKTNVKLRVGQFAYWKDFWHVEPCTKTDKSWL